MSKQIRFYLLPSDIDDVLGEIRHRFGAKLIAAKSDTHQPSEIESPFSAFPVTDQSPKSFSYVHCYLTPLSGANIKMRYAPKLDKWLVEDEGAEVIQFSGCRYSDRLLEIGRFYYLTDMLIGDTIWRQRKEFTVWADKIFQAAKKHMRYSRGMMAYVGKDADLWKRDGGRFASLTKPDGTPIYADE